MKRNKIRTIKPTIRSTGLLVLEIGAGPKPSANILFPGCTVETLDVDPQYNPTYLHDAITMPEELYGKFDVVLASHVLEHFPWYDSLNVLTEWSKAAKIGGQVHVIVPSLEWAAEEILSGKPSKAIYGHLYAGCVTQWDVHKAGFTMQRLRALFEGARLGVFLAGSGPYPIQILGKVMRAEQHYVAGMKGN